MSSCKIFYGRHLLKTTSTTQAVVRISSAEFEFFAAVKAAAAGIGCVSIVRDLGVMLQQQRVEVKAKGSGDDVDSPSLEIKLDAKAGRAIAMRRGAGRIRHIATPTLWLQRLVINGDIKMTRVGGSDLGTKHVDCRNMIRHLKFCAMRFAEGRSRIAPQLEHLTETGTGGSLYTPLLHGMSGYCGYWNGNLVWRRSPNAQSCDSAWTATSQGGVCKSELKHDV